MIPLIPINDQSFSICSGLTGGENEQENTLIQLLVEMDGMLIV